MSFLKLAQFHHAAAWMKLSAAQIREALKLTILFVGLGVLIGGAVMPDYNFAKWSNQVAKLEKAEEKIAEIKRRQEMGGDGYGNGLQNLGEAMIASFTSVEKVRAKRNQLEARMAAARADQVFVFTLVFALVSFGGMFGALFGARRMLDPETGRLENGVQ